MELVGAGWSTRKWLRFDKTIRYLTSGDLGIPLAVIQLGVVRLKTTKLCISYICLGEWGRKGTAI